MAQAHPAKSDLRPVKRYSTNSVFRKAFACADFSLRDHPFLHGTNLAKRSPPRVSTGLRSPGHLLTAQVGFDASTNLPVAFRIGPSRAGGCEMASALPNPSVGRRLVIDMADPIGRVISKIHDAALDPRLWTSVLQSVTEAVGAVGAAYIVRNARTGRVDWANFLVPAPNSHRTTLPASPPKIASWSPSQV